MHVAQCHFVSGQMTLRMQQHARAIYGIPQCTHCVPLFADMPVSQARGEVKELKAAKSVQQKELNSSNAQLTVSVTAAAGQPRTVAACS